MTKLIVSEKGNVAKRIASILADGKIQQKETNKVPVYAFSQQKSQVRCFGLKGHLLKVDFPTQYNNWQNTDLLKLVDAPIIKIPTHKSILKALQKEAKGVDEIIIACDFDREGELIGVDAVNMIREVNPDAEVKRARFSALTEQEIKRAFSSLDDIYINLAQAGEARQDIDLVWGAALTRFLSLAATRLGKQFLSVGRVQSPTLWLIVARERERQAFVVKPYWCIKALFRRQNGHEFVAYHKTERFWQKQEAEGVLEKLKGVGKVAEVKKVSRQMLPPAPFNTTSFLQAAASIGISPNQAMMTAESLYNQGLISYPRVDNTVYPPSLNFHQILAVLSNQEELGSLAREVGAQKELTPTRGKKQATDHPPIHPTGAADKSKLHPRAWKVYELVARRFLATLAQAAVAETVRIDIDASGEIFLVKGITYIKEGYLKFYHYGRRREEEVPDLKKEEELSLVGTDLEGKETQPPARLSQGKLIREMEKLGLGTKSTRHSIIQNLYDRDYILNDPIEPTELGLKVAEALRKYAEKISTPQMTAELEKEMDQIADGAEKRDKVVERSRALLAGVMLNLKEKETEVAEEIREGIREDRARSRLIGTCPGCGKNLKVVRSKKSKKRFVGCESYPECNVSYPLPQKGNIVPLGKNCEVCSSPKIRVFGAGRSAKSRYWELCVDPKCSTKDKKKTGNKEQPTGDKKQETGDKQVESE